ncbi:MAG: hypothetical protein J07HQW2_00627 [Haloquadratum walsbyi J07HQW2]|uniref:Uncharacterized protein n=1 Tax=Haloquadratum walsbyi J07HQW2 TaxID=1238425 RepID=U1NBY8_9EURY|nr:MAG: hypothetical protein J07HQW2_00627 [Haloquadratum walsbyi J07HQW2]
MTADALRIDKDILRIHSISNSPIFVFAGFIRSKKGLVRGFFTFSSDFIISSTATTTVTAIALAPPTTVAGSNNVIQTTGQPPVKSTSID